MRPVHGYASASSIQSLLRGFPRNSLLSRDQAQWLTRPWICQKCYQHNQRAVNSTRAFERRLHQRLKSPAPPQVQEARVQFSTSPSKFEPRDLSSETSKFRDDLPSQEEGRRSHLSKRLVHIIDHLQSNIFIAGQRLNDLTGYSGIEALKKDIEQQEELVRTTRSSLQKAREDYSAAIAQRSNSQREVNELLQRKHAWTSNDLERFTALYRSDHANEQAEIAAQEKLAAVERQAEEANAKLSACILARYHEEQIWSDKIRRMSTWGTWGLMGVNILLFLLFQVAVEPWRRKRLVKGFEDKVMEALEREGSAGATLAQMHAAKEMPAVVDATQEAQVHDAQVAEEVLPEPGSFTEEGVPRHLEVENSQIVHDPVLQSPTPMSRTEIIRAMIRDMFSERHVTVRRVDQTNAMMQGAAAGVAFMGVLVLLLRPR